MKIITKARVRMNGEIEWIAEDRDHFSLPQVQEMTRQITRLIFNLSNLNLYNEKHD